MRALFVITTLVGLIFVSESRSEELSEATCKALSDVAQTRPAKADLEKVRSDLLKLHDLKGRLILTELPQEMISRLNDLFQRDPSTVSKLEQFYGLLYLIGRHKSVSDRRVDFNPEHVRSILLSSKVFSTPDVPNAITSVTLFWSRAFKKATYLVHFNTKELHLPLNGGKGFATYKEGLCQIAQKLIFYGGFEFDVETTSNDHYYVSKFKDVDLYGIFGSRGTVNVDINYVSIKSVEFLKGSPMGIVRAKVSRREFEMNSHNVLLRFVTNFVTDKSTQPIDW
jgi:hypothetical protein